ncbi:MAG: hypothetical protein JOY85_18625, partial [Acidobacteriaceae bacterium]|nr:hypothetical protein [Acidobacteriaceae bacterium]
VSDHRGGDLPSFLAAEQRRYRAQMDDYAALLSRMAKGPIFLGLYFPLLDAWQEWEFVAEVAGVAF